MKKFNQTLAILMVFAFAVLCLSGVELTVKAAEQVEVRASYHYVNEAGENSRYSEVRYVPVGTKWREFLQDGAHENGVITDAHANNEWQDKLIKIGNRVGYASDWFDENEVANWSNWGHASIAIIGMPSTYRQVDLAVSWYEDGEMVDSGRGYDCCVPNEYAYGSAEAIAYIQRNVGIYDNLAPYVNREGTSISVTPNRPANGPSMEGYFVSIYAVSSSEGGDVGEEEEEMDVITSSGEALGSTVSISNVTANAVVITNPYQNVAAAAGLTDGQAVTASVTGYLGPEAQKVLDNAVMSANANLAYALEIALNSDDGVSVHELSSPITLVMALPENLDGNVYDFAVIHIHGDGTVTLLPDLDDDPRTVTVSSDRFSVYAVVYGAKGSFSTARGSSSAVRDSVPKTGHTFPAAVPVAVAASLVAAAVMTLSLNKRKRA